MALPAFRPGRRAAETDLVPGNSRARSGRKEAVARAAASGPHLHRGLPSQALVLCFPCAHLHWAVVVCGLSADPHAPSGTICVPRAGGRCWG